MKAGDEVSHLTDAELIRRFRLLDARRAAEESRLRPHPDPQVRAGEEPLRFHPFPDWSPEVKPFLQEMAGRMAAMFRAALLAQELSVADVARAVAYNDTTVIDWVERGSAWTLTDPDFFERACTEGGLDPEDVRLRRTYWFPLLGHPRCRTIRPASVDGAWLAWNGGAVESLARSIARGRSFELLPVLGDALEEAGCADAEILAHCRAPGEHVLGCWVVDALVGPIR